MRQFFYYKMRQEFITKCVTFFIIKWDNLLQNMTIITKCDDFYYKIRYLLQNASVQLISYLKNRAQRVK